jgi:hypothetical protein
MRLLVLLVALASGLRADLFSSADISGSISSPPWIDSGATASGNCHDVNYCYLDLSVPDLSVSLRAEAGASYGTLDVFALNRITSDNNDLAFVSGTAVSTASASFSDQFFLGGDYAFVQFTLLNNWVYVTPRSYSLSVLLDGSPADLSLVRTPFGCTHDAGVDQCGGWWTTPVLPVNGDTFSLSVLASVSALALGHPPPEASSFVQLESIQFFGADEQPIEDAYYQSLSGSQYPVINGHVVPEPKSVWLFGSVILMVACSRRRTALALGRRPRALGYGTGLRPNQEPSLNFRGKA